MSLDRSRRALLRTGAGTLAATGGVAVMGTVAAGCTAYDYNIEVTGPADCFYRVRIPTTCSDDASVTLVAGEDGDESVDESFDEIVIKGQPGSDGCDTWYADECDDPDYLDTETIECDVTVTNVTVD
ncbi:MAG: hypothetical protein ABEI99_06460 [Halobaculum sp.]